MTDKDIVTKLNREADQQVIPEYSVTTYARRNYAASLMHEAADEIERLRKERDEARREVCDLKSFNYDQRISPEAYAALNKWDCYKDHAHE
jgi:hypothetical protein